MYTGQCIVTYWLFGNWLGAVQCPVCRQTVSLLLRDFPANAEGGEEIEQSIRDYNRRFSGQPRPVSIFAKLEHIFLYNKIIKSSNTFGFLHLLKV